MGNRLLEYRSMTYKLDFHPLAFKEWNSLDAPIREQFKQKLAERLENPLHQPSKLSVRVLKVLKPQNRRNLKRDYLNFKKRIWQNPSYFKQKQTG